MKKNFFTLEVKGGTIALDVTRHLTVAALP
jgi:hypothetical protein